MKESRYIELLNLYVDHQLTPAEAAELEAEVQRSPSRRRLYSQYCRMQKACTLLFDAERSLAPKTAAVVSAIHAGRPLQESVPFWAWGSVRFAGMAAAFVFVALVGYRWASTPPPLAQGSVASVDVVPAALVAANVTVPSVVEIAQPAPVQVANAPAAVRAPFQSVLIGTTLVLSRIPDGEAPTASSVDLAWLNQVKMPVVRTLPDEDLAFDDRPSLKQPETRVYRSRQPFQGNAEMISFQFQR